MRLNLLAFHLTTDLLERLQPWFHALHSLLLRGFHVSLVDVGAHIFGLLDPTTCLHLASRTQMHLVRFDRAILEDVVCWILKEQLFD